MAGGEEAASPGRSRDAPWGRRAAVSALTLLVLAALIELFFRLLVPPLAAPPLRFEFPNRMGLEARSLESLFRPSATRFWELEPGAREPFGGDALGSRGMRGPEPAEGPVLRVVVLGDSCTYGVLTGYPQTYAARLERRLRALRPDRAIEVLNGGVPGYTLFQGLVLFEELVAPLRPDVVVLYYGAWNDFGPALGASDLERAEGARPATAFQRLYGAFSWLRAVQWFGDRYAGTLRHRHWRATVNAWLAGEPPDGYRVPPADFEALLERLLARCEELGATPIVVLPELDVTRPEGHEICYGRLDVYRALLARAAERRGLATVDLRALFPEALHPELFADRVHPGPQGNLWLADELARRIAAAELLDAAPPLLPEAREAPPVRLRELALDPREGGTVHVEVDLGPDHAGAEVHLLASCAPAPYAMEPRPPSPPLVVDEVGGALTPRGSYVALLDAEGRASLAVGVPADLPALRERRALGFAVARATPAGPAWAGEAWLPLEPAQPGVGASR